MPEFSQQSFRPAKIHRTEMKANQKSNFIWKIHEFPRPAKIHRTEMKANQKSNFIWKIHE